MVLAQVRRAVRAVQSEHSLTTVTNDMYMRRPVIIRINDNSAAKNIQDSRHSIRNLSRLGLWVFITNQ